MDGNFTIVKRWVAGLVGIGVLWGSIVFSRNGFQFETNSEYGWIGWLLAVATSAAQFMMTSDFRKINWSILLLGTAAYSYSIYTNIQGFHSLRTELPPYDVINVLGSIFMDVYPEVAIAWALNESRLGDLVGNIIQSTQNPSQLTSRGGNIPQSQTKPIIPAPNPYLPPSRRDAAYERFLNNKGASQSNPSDIPEFLQKGNRK